MRLRHDRTGNRCVLILFVKYEIMKKNYSYSISYLFHLVQK